MLTSHVEREVVSEGTANADGTFSGRINTRYRTWRNASSAAELTLATAKALVASAKVYVKSDRGDFSTGDFRLTASTGATGCPAGKLAKVATGDRAGQLAATLTGATGANALVTDVAHRFPLRNRIPGSSGPGCILTMDVTENAKLEAATPPGDFKAIRAQKFSADVEVTIAGSVPAQFARKTVSGGAAGEIVRDGTTVQLPYLTTRAGYMQSVKLTNRSTKPANFWIESVSTADGAGPTSKATASTPMNVGAGARASVAAGDLVDFGADGTEGAATLSVSAPSDNIDVATVLTNLASNSTDTSLVKPEPAAAAPPPPPSTDIFDAFNCTALSFQLRDVTNFGAGFETCRKRPGAASCTTGACCSHAGSGTCRAGGAACPTKACRDD